MMYPAAEVGCMAKDERQTYRMVSRRVARVREIYSRIGVPLSAEIITDLYRHMGRLCAIQPQKRKGLRH